MAGVAVVAALTAAAAGQATPAVARAAGMAIPSSANQLIVVSSPTDDPPDYLGHAPRLRAREPNLAVAPRVRPMASRDWLGPSATRRRAAGGRPRDPGRGVRHRQHHVRKRAESRRPSLRLPPPGMRRLVGRRPALAAVQPVRPRGLRCDAVVRVVVGAVVDGDRRVPVFRGCSVQHEPDAWRRERAGLGDLPAQLGRRRDRGVRGPARVAASGSSSLAQAGQASGHRDRHRCSGARARVPCERATHIERGARVDSLRRCLGGDGVGESVRTPHDRPARPGKPGQHRRLGPCSEHGGAAGVGREDRDPGAVRRAGADSRASAARGPGSPSSISRRRSTGSAIRAGCRPDNSSPARLSAGSSPDGPRWSTSRPRCCAARPVRSS